ncbi:MAG TPA: OmpA family protein [bacterium]|nr:OmpA family protein [bacterium]
MRKLCFTAVCVVVILAAAVSFGYERRVGLGVNAGAAILSNADKDKAGFDERASMGPMMGFVLRHSISNHLSLGFTANYGYNYDKDSKSFRTNLIPLDVNLIYNFGPDKRTSPYILGSLGMLAWNSNYRPAGISIDSQREGALGVGAGLDIFLTDIMALDICGRLRYITNDKCDDMIGRSWDLGIISNDNLLWTITAGITWYPGKCKDSDGDGVCDSKDKCPDTPPCAVVDEFGCPKDSDGDGVWDGCDKCPDTPKCATVDAKGCPKDSDGDGVWDGCDKCPDTPKCCVVDANGCPKDEDGDGVCDGCDKCPGTPKGVQVDDVGCPKKCDLSPLEGITFRFDKSDVVPSPSPILDQAVAIIKGCPKSKIEIQGHTDSMGSDEYNMKLGQRRADAVKKYLVDHGIETERLFTKSYGESKPIDTNNTDAGRAKNRRIEFHEID